MSKESLPFTEAKPFQVGSRYKSTAQLLFSFELLVCFLVLLFRLRFLSLFSGLFLCENHQILTQLYCTYVV